MTAMMTPLRQFPCFSRKFAPRCCACNLPIAPKEGEESASRVRVFDKDWHPECFKCAVRLLTSGFNATYHTMSLCCVASIIQFYLFFQSGLRLRVGRGRRQKVLPEGRHTPLPRLQQGEEVMSQRLNCGLNRAHRHSTSNCMRLEAFTHSDN